MTIVGSATAFDQRIVKIQGKVAVPSPPRGDERRAEVTLCTADRQRFLEQPLEGTVSDAGGALISQTIIERVACRLSASPAGNEESDQIFLDDAGVLFAKFGEPKTFASCFLPDYPLHCDEKDF